MSTASIIFDLVVLAIFIITVAYYAKQGFFAAILSLVGTVAAFFAAYFSSQKLAPEIFDQFFRPGLETRASEALADQSLKTIDEVLNSIAGFLPQGIIDEIARSLEANSTADTADFAAEIVGDLLAPFFVPVIAIVIFLIIFIVLRVVLGMLVGMLVNVNKIPLLGTANHALGAVMGVCIGALYVFFIVMIMQGSQAVFDQNVMDNGYFGDSIVYRLFSGMDIFTK